MMTDVDRCGTYDKKTSVSFKDYNVKVYILVRGTVTVVGKGANAAAIATDRNNKQLIF